MTRRSKGRSAYGAAMMKTLESHVPSAERLFDDPMIAEFLPAPLRLALRAAWVRERFRTMMEREAPGVLGTMVCRTRYIDDAIRKAAADGIETVVLLGAGLDTRAYRLPELRTTTVIEIDLPSVQSRKTARLARCGGTPAHVRYIPTDLAAEPLASTLARAGLAPDARALFVWEGVTQYLPGDAVSSVVRVLGARPRGTELLFTYIVEDAVTGRFLPGRSDAFRKSAARQPEPWLFGLDPADVAPFLSERGFTLVEDIGASDYEARYLRPRSRTLAVTGIERVARAAV
jgi:methyltransferase (TIGR00027 family)